MRNDNNYQAGTPARRPRAISRLRLRRASIAHAWLRWTIILLCLITPLLVAFARLYRGMHYILQRTAKRVDLGGSARAACAGWRIDLATAPTSRGEPVLDPNLGPVAAAACRRLSELGRQVLLPEEPLSGARGWSATPTTKLPSGL